MENMEKSDVEGILQEYKEEIQNLLRGEKTKSFDEITGKAIEKMKNKLKDEAEETTEEENKKSKKKVDVQFVEEK
jgi:hypothetical protein